MKTTYKTLLAAFCCTMALTVQAQERTFSRNKVLIEKFTGTGCPNCPYADGIIDNYVKNNNFQDDVAILRHHSFSSGLLNTSCSVAVAGTWFITGAPYMMVDRYGFFGDPKDNRAHFTSNALQVRSYKTIETRLERPTFVSLSLDGSSFDPTTKKLHLVLSGEVTKDLPFLRVHAFITQSGIVKQQSTETGVTSDYVHDDAVRDCITVNVDGDSFKVNPDGTYSVTLDKTIADKYGIVTSVPKDMKVVAFVSSYVDENESFYTRDYSTSEVHNAEAVSLLDLPKEILCASPTIELKDGAFVCTSTTAGATCHYDITPLTQPTDGRETIDLTAPAFTVTAYAEAPGYARSAKVRRTFSLRDILGEDSSDVRDVDGNGTVNKADVEALVNKLLKK